MNGRGLPQAPDPRPLVAHVVYRFAVGGLENGVVNLINRLSPRAWRHAVIALTEVDASFGRRIERDDVRLLSLHKPPGQGVWQYPRLVRLFREMRPAIVHTRNLAALEAQVPAWWGGVPGRVHGEHGRDADDPHGRNRRHIWTRRAYRSFVHRQVALSGELAAYLCGPVGVDRARVERICNGVDSVRFTPAPRRPPEGCPFTDPGLWLVGTVGRMQPVKAQTVLVQAFVQALQRQPSLRQRLRLVMVGEGPLRAECESLLDAAGLRELAWFAGERNDVPHLLRGLDCFVLPSRFEGISNGILEAMACGLPVLATAVGGNAELVTEGVTGHLVPADDPDALAAALVTLSADPEAARAMGRAGRQAVEDRFSLEAMVAAYDRLYRGLLPPMPAGAGEP